MLKASALGVGAMAFPGVALADDSGFPPVPGMLGDRRANEMWYVLDERTYYHPAQEVVDAYGAVGALVGGDPFFGLWERWMELSAQPDYPRNYAEFMTPVKPQLTLLSRLQLSTFDEFYRPNSRGFVDAMSLFAQGVLFDPRRPAEDAVHTMGALPYYHAWHAYLRAMMFLGIDCERWARIDPVVGFAWAVQSVAKPARDHVNPPLPPITVARLAASWLPRTPERLDRDFRSTPERLDRDFRSTPEPGDL